MQTTHNKTYRFYPRATADLIEIWDYGVATWSVAQAIKYENQILDACDAIVANPTDGDDISYLRDGYLLWRVARHFIIYRISDHGIDIVRILHQMRDIKKHI